VITGAGVRAHTIPTISATTTRPPEADDRSQRGGVARTRGGSAGGPRRPRSPLPGAVGVAVASLLVPGVGQAIQRRRGPAVIFGLASALAFVALLSLAGEDKATLVTWTTDAGRLHHLVIMGLLWSVVCAVAAADAFLAQLHARPRRRDQRGLNIAVLGILVLVALVPGSVLAWVATRQDSMLDKIFTSGKAEVARPDSLEALGVTTVAPAAGIPNQSAVATTAASLAVVPNRWTIALLGGDAGPDRWGLRTDTMVVLSIDRDTGDIAGVSIPRNLKHLPMPAGVLRDRFPEGFDDLANALFPYVATRPALGVDPAQAIKGALAQLLGVAIDNYVLVDMAGFEKIVNALGGVTLDLTRKVPLVGNMDGSPQVPSVGPGRVHMDGKMALSFVRTRQADSDYGRMGRQRCLLTAVARNTSPARLVRSYPSLVKAVEGAFKTDIPRDHLGDLVTLFGKVHIDQARTLALVPPVVTPAHPDYLQIRQLVSDLLDPSKAVPQTPDLVC